MTMKAGPREWELMMDKRFSLWIGVEASLLRTDTVHISPFQGAKPRGKTSIIDFIAVFPESNPETIVVGSDEQTCEMIRAHMTEGSLDAETLLRAAQSLNKDFAGICPILSNDAKDLTLTLRPDIVKQHEPGSTEVMAADGRLVSNLADGPIFTIDDDNGVAAWAATKPTLSFAHDVRVEVREDRRGEGLGKIVTSHAVQAIIDSETTPFYMHVDGNAASARLGASLGFVRYGTAVFAETSLQ